ncbi:MAG: hypothetical protein ACQBVK_04290 [Candidatus Phytoplasma sp. TWB_XP]
MARWGFATDNNLAFFNMNSKNLSHSACPQGGIGDKCESLPSFYTRHFENNKICSRNYFFIIYTIIITYY